MLSRLMAIGHGVILEREFLGLCMQMYVCARERICYGVSGADATEPQ